MTSKKKLGFLRQAMEEGDWIIFFSGVWAGASISLIIAAVFYNGA